MGVRPFLTHLIISKAPVEGDPVQGDQTFSLVTSGLTVVLSDSCSKAEVSPHSHKPLDAAAKSRHREWWWPTSPGVSRLPRALGHCDDHRADSSSSGLCLVDSAGFNSDGSRGSTFPATLPCSNSTHRHRIKNHGAINQDIYQEVC